MNDSWGQASQVLFLFAPFANRNMTLNVCPVLDLDHSPLNTSAEFKHTVNISKIQNRQYYVLLLCAILAVCLKAELVLRGE